MFTITKTVAAICLVAATTLVTTKQTRAQDNCPPVTFYISTGIDNANNLLPFNSPDPNWTAPVGMGNVINPAAALPTSAWATLTGSGWLGKLNAITNITFNYYRSFYVPPTAINASISLSSLADNFQTIFIDGIIVGQSNGFTAADVFNYSAPLTPTLSGWHTVRADVFNFDGPAGLDLRGTVTYQPTVVSRDISTGILNGFMLSLGVPDPNWTSPLAGYNIVEASNSPWDNFTGSQWLGTGNFNTYAPGGYYTYSRSFTLPGSGGTLTFESMADDEAFYFLDNNPKPIANTVGAYGAGWGFKLINKASYSSSTLSSGQHTLTVVVRNQESESTPVGFNLHGHIDVSCSDAGGPGDDPAGKSSSFSTLAIPTVTTPTALAEFALYPNPARDEIRFSRSLNECELQVINLDGRKALELKQFNGEKLDISTLAAGSYMLRVIQNNTVTTLKFSKTE